MATCASSRRTPEQQGLQLQRELASRVDADCGLDVNDGPSTITVPARELRDVASAVRCRVTKRTAPDRWKYLRTSDNG